MNSRNFRINKSRRQLLWLALALSFVWFMFSGAVARAEKEEWDDLPTKTTVNGYAVEYVAPQGNNLTTDNQVNFSFRVTDNTGKPVSGLSLKFIGVRDYSGQVKKEHNGPRDPQVGPIDLVAGTQAGEYVTSTPASFWHNGHWRIYVDGAIFGTERAKFTQSIAVSPDTEAGIRLDWLLWVGLVIAVGTVVLVIGNKGVRYEVPAKELAGANEGRG